MFTVREKSLAGYIVLIVLIVAALAMFLCWRLIPDTRQSQAIQEYEDSLAQLGSVTPMGETMILDSEKVTVTDFEGEQECIFDWSGTMKVKVLSADLYESRAAAKLERGLDESDFDDGEAFLLCKVQIENVAAVLSDNNGWVLTNIEPKSTFGELTYVWCKDGKRVGYSHDTPTARLKSGQAETYTLGWCLYEIPSNFELDFDHEELTACTLEVTDHRTTAQ